MKNNFQGLFISFEGGEASGKTTQIRKIKKWFIHNRLNYVLTREPGGTKFAESLRKIILSPKNNITIEQEILLLMTSRIDHLNNVIKPALDQKKIVVTDRFVDSTAVYQGYYNKFGIKNIYELHKLFLNNTFPDLTFFFHTPPEIIKKRLKKRMYKNKYDIIHNKFNNQINKGFLKIAKNNKRFIIIDGSLPIKTIYDIIINSIRRKLLKYGVKIQK
tara:strand:+ start:64 stop:714 length:651 start_codon:yes stop_codon:yes gene_type:complete